MTARDANKAEAALKAKGFADRVIWWGRFVDHTTKGGVYVVDTKDVDEMRVKLGEGPWMVDGWWSDTLLELIPRAPL